MKIELNGPASSSQVDTVARVNTTSTTSTQNTAEDRITFHSASIQSLASQAMQSPDVREASVQALRQSVSSGEYSANAVQTAHAMGSQQ
jgi:anti-sigma28 factor (negative regulator of flagellin synthesis)